MYLNVYVPQLQRVSGVVWYLRGHLGQRFASTAAVAPKTVAFVAGIEKFVAEQRKLISESRKLDRDRWLAPLVLGASLLGGVIGAIITHLWR